MSEINSIANGTFTIGQTSATNFQAGPGISITQPSEGIVRISNDETVLWETETPVRISAETNLNESLNNFEHIDFYFCGGYITNNDTVNTINPTTAICFMHGAGISNVWYQWTHLSANPDMNKIIFDKGKSFNFGAATSTTWSNPSISTGVPDSFYCYKIVGINRKEV